MSYSDLRNRERGPKHIGRVVISGGNVIDPVELKQSPGDLLLEDGLISAIDKPGSFDSLEGVSRLDAKGKFVAPGLVDMHVHLREPGFEYKETIATGTRSAVAGGVTSVACMANTDPVNDNASVTKFIIERAEVAGLANVFPIGAVSKKLAGVELAEMGGMFEAGIVAVSDDGMPIMNSELMRRALEYARMFNLPVIVHEEDTCLCSDGVMNEGAVSMRLGLKGLPSAGESVMVARDIELARATGGRLHVAHISCKDAVDMVRRAKREGLSVTAEASPHHFTLDESAVDGYNTNAKMKPPLRTRADVEAVREGLADGSIDAVATDHAPHHRDEKVVEFDRAAFGIVGLETMLPLTLGLVRDGVLSLERAIEAMTLAPSRILGLDRGTLAIGAAADIVVFDRDCRWPLVASELHSKSHNTPFDGSEMCGKAVFTLVGGRLLHGETVS
jgi:dihydroorotase